MPSAGEPASLPRLPVFISPAQVDQLLASIIRDDFAWFVRRMWDQVPENNGVPLVWNWHMDVLCEEMQKAAERVFLRLPKEHDIAINVPPGSSKSTICSVMFPAWVWTRMPNARFICSSYSHKLSLDLSRKCRDVVEGDLYRRLFPEFSLRGDQNAKEYYINHAGGFRFAVSTGGTVTGYHADFIIVDDPVNPKEAYSDKEREEANRFVGETLASRKTNKKVTLTILIMQRLHQEDPTAVLLERAKKGYPIRHICLPAKIDAENRSDVRPRKLLRHYSKDGLLDPERIPQESLDAALVEMGQYGYAGQMLQSPVPKGGGMFKVDRLKIEECPPRRHFKRLVRFWDKAATKDGGAWTAGVLLGEHLNGGYWVLDVVRGQWDTATRERIIRQTAELDGRVVEIGVEQEPGSGGKDSMLATVNRLAGFRVRVVRPTGSKEDRADPFSVQVNAENVSMAKADWNKAYVDELRHFPYSTYKDQVDASGGAFNLLTIVRKLGGWT